MRLGLIGNGKMAKAVGEAAGLADHEVITSLTSLSSPEEWQRLADADVCIDFSTPEAFLANIDKLAAFGKPLVVGTTGWLSRLEQVRCAVEKRGTALLYGQNFALGMILFQKIVSEAARMVEEIDSYDVAIQESHHRHKLDSPSGSAIKLAEILIANISRKTKICKELGDNPIAAEELHVSSTRLGAVFGTHSVIFDSGNDTITLTHQAHTRKIWAEGALKAAAWIQGRQGIYTIEEMVEDSLCKMQQ